MSWSNSRKSFAEKQLDSMTLTLPEEFTSKCVKTETMVAAMKSSIETDKVHEEEAEQVYNSVNQMVVTVEDDDEVMGVYGDKIEELRRQLEAIKNQANKSK